MDAREVAARALYEKDTDRARLRRAWATANGAERTFAFEDATAVLEGLEAAGILILEPIPGDPTKVHTQAATNDLAGYVIATGYRVRQG